MSFQIYFSLRDVFKTVLIALFNQISRLDSWGLHIWWIKTKDGGVFFFPEQVYVVLLPHISRREMGLYVFP